MTQIKELEKLPYIDVTVRLYETSEPYEVIGDTKKYFATFRGADCSCDVIFGKTKVGSVSGGIGGGLFARIEDREFYLPPDDFWNVVRETIGFVYPEVEEEVDEPQEEEEEEEETFEALQEEEAAKEPEIVDAGKVFPVDWKAKPSGIFGGNLSDIPKPHYWYFKDGGKKRKVTFTISRFYGIGGNHYYLSFKEEQDYIWDGREDEHDPGRPRGWIRLWEGGKETGKGLSVFDIQELFEGTDSKEKLPGRFDYLHEAKEMIDRIVAKYFPNHEVVYEDYSGDFYYQKEGD